MQDGAGVLLALFVYPLGVHLIKGGPAEMWAWVKAKWLNDTGASSAAAHGGGGVTLTAKQVHGRAPTRPPARPRRTAPRGQRRGQTA